MGNVLGLVKAKDLVGTVEAADAMMKSADVQLIDYEKADSGPITVMVRGDADVVKAAADTGSAAASVASEAEPSHVIPRPYSDVEAILPRSI